MADIIHCPSCRKPLQVPESYLGQTVQCPECRHQFTAASESVSPQPPVLSTPSVPRPRYHDDPYDDDRRRRDRYDDDDAFDIARPERIRNEFAPHRGGVILALGLVSLVGGMSMCGLPAVVGPFAWVMGSNDLREIREGRMDPSGEGMTRAGQVCGIVGTVILVLALLYVFCVVGMIAGDF